MRAGPQKWFYRPGESMKLVSANHFAHLEVDCVYIKSTAVPFDLREKQTTGERLFCQTVDMILFQTRVSKIKLPIM
jgi:hypothetical protein